MSAPNRLPAPKNFAGPQEDFKSASELLKADVRFVPKADIR
jgi:hypothetical protein